MGKIKDVFDVDLRSGNIHFHDWSIYDIEKMKIDINKVYNSIILKDKVDKYCKENNVIMLPYRCNEHMSEYYKEVYDYCITKVNNYYGDLVKYMDMVDNPRVKEGSYWWGISCLRLKFCNHDLPIDITPYRFFVINGLPVVKKGQWQIVARKVLYGCKIVSRYIINEDKIDVKFTNTSYFPTLDGTYENEKDIECEDIIEAINIFINRENKRIKNKCG